MGLPAADWQAHIANQLTDLDPRRLLPSAVSAAEMGAVILPPAFYHMPRSIMDIIHQSVGKALDQVGIEHDLFRRWSGAAKHPSADTEGEYEYDGTT